MHTKSSLRLSFALLLLLVVETLAEDDDTDFLMNVFSDLGPVLALFGEQFARQFLSETFTWYDHVIFACVPLGIMTAIAGAIRVQGHKFLKAFIGRARENRAAAEIEYMSSTSAEVGELFNGRGIVRTMGQPGIAQFIVFPDELLKEKKGAQNQSYGIHTLKSASQEGILYKEGYCDELDLAAQNWLKSFKHTETRKKDVEQAEDGFGPSISRSERTTPLQKNDRFPKYRDSLKSPNLQLNIATEKISPKRRSIELHLAAIIAVILQASLLVIAAVVPYRAQGYESQPWGLPCYIGGSVLLFIGMLACSVAIERSTKEFKWRPSPGISNETQDSSEVRPQSMDLFWVQRTQRVSDQDFDSYVISSRNKQFISTSSRREDVLSGKSNKGNKGHKQTKNGQIDDIPSEKSPKGNKSARSDEDRRLESDFLAVTAIFAGGAGFTIQFIGLRGLPWPCAVAQLGAIIAMAIIRALVRRKLGDDPNYCPAPSRYELDLLATQLVDSSSTSPPNQPLKPSQKDWTWRVDTSKHRLQSIYSFRIGNCLNPSVSNLIQEDSASSQAGQSSEAQRIMLVRRRLGDLVRWETEAFKPALALARSIERFLDEFMPAASNQDLTEWGVPMRDSEDNRSVVTLAITKKGSRGWQIKVGEVEAILSLWMAHLEATKVAKTKDKEKADWQRSKAGITLGVDYCRILGPSDQRRVLERDIKWWVGNPAVTEITMAKRMDDETTGSRHRPCEASYHCKDPERDDVKMVIGFMGPLKPDTRHKLLVQHSTAGLATIAAQHLFTSFLWTIVDLDQLSKDFLDQGSINIHESVSIQPPKPLDLESTKLGTGRKLSHTKLTRFALHAEKEGLGVLDDILLCLIPIFSIKDVLPNDVVLKLDLPGLRERSTWVKDASAYLALLKFMTKESKCSFDDYLSLAAVVHALDYIYLMTLDDENMAYGNTLHQEDDKISESKSNDSGGETKSPSRQSSDDYQMLLVYISQLYPDVVRRLLAFYELQERKDYFYDLGRRCEETETWPPGFGNEKEGLIKQIRFTSLHDQASIMAPIDLRVIEGKDWKKRDIFGWTALHYAASCKEFNVVEECQHPILRSNQLPGCLKALLRQSHPQTWWFDNIGRSPIHVACLTGNQRFLERLLQNLSTKDARASLEAKGLDGMTPVHLAIQRGHAECIAVIKKVIRLQELELPTDAWKRSPIHLAICQGKYDCCKELICDEKLMFNPYTLDVHGRSLFSYLDEEEDEQKLIGSLLLKIHSRLFRDKDNEGQSVWHYGIRFLREEATDILQDQHLSTINASNDSGETPLHLAVKVKSEKTVDLLLKLGARTEMTAKEQSPLMFACSRGEAKMVYLMLNSNKRAAEEVDKEGKSPLHYVIECKSCNDEDQEKIVKWLVSALKSGDIDAEDQRSWTPLHVACQNSKSSIVSILVDKGADPSVKDDKGNNALHHAVGLWPPVSGSTFTWTEEVAEKVLNRSPDCISDVNEDGRTPLFSALMRDEEQASIFLLRNGADPQFTTEKEFQTPFMWACAQGRPLAFISMVVRMAEQQDSKVDLNQGDALFDQSPLAWACDGNSTEVVKLLLETRKSVQLQDKLDLNRATTRYGNYTPLHIVLMKSNHEILELLLDDPRIVRGLGATKCDDLNLLEFAFEKSDQKCLTALLLHHHTKSVVFFTAGWERIVQKHASLVDNVELWEEWERAILDPKHKVRYLIHKLAEAGRKEKIESLRQSGMNVHELDEDNWTPADIAARYHHKELEQFLRKDDPVHRCRRPSTFINVYEGPKLSISPYESQESPRSFILGRLFLYAVFVYY
ncbi:serine threonine phosphatase 6 regulatory ankyrin repeat subunit A [Fusarium pseudocircinatum]|uniref:Serine threonine phosphatase 6 regulatory ankyrin repeat subunit A n=1 Tax=Fusarium pseudocircinatum TaxID=56676 RepID=A0A8H5PZW2_9HYPO|nr:serine threonine phosphatase 6 regulatory ankyrin repeat subunit A [Fusarium pseudocircinatum]